MILALSTRYRKLSAFSLLYLFFISGLSSVVYGNSGYSSSRYLYLGDGRSVKGKENKRNSGLSGLREYSQKSNGVPTSIIGTRPSKRIFEPIDDIGGPGQPEMSAFKPVGADNMVDLFTGDFSYNIPLMDVGGYPVNIFYNSGVTMDQEASWCGLGWNINPGTISRNMRGLPDDFDGSKGDQITKTQFSKPEKTFGVGVGGSVEVFGGALKLGLDAGIFFNNMRGVGLEAGISPSIGIGAAAGDSKTAPLTLGWKLKANSQSGGSSTFSISLADREKNGLGGSLTASLGYHSRMGLQSLHIDAEVSKLKTGDQNKQSLRSTIADGDFSASVLSSGISFAYPAVTPTMRARQSSQNYSINLGFGGELWGVFGHLRLGGYYSRIGLKDVTVSQPAYGMLYMQKGNNDKNALLDFNRLNDGVYTPNAPTIAIPVYTYDIFSISGEGTGGTFRAYRGDMGSVNDAYIESESDSKHLGLELGAGTYAHGGINANLVYTPTSAGEWKVGNLAKNSVQFKNSNGAYQSVYFKNPGEKAIPDTVYQNAIGGEDLVRLKMTNLGIGSPTLIPTLMRYTDTRQLKTGQDVRLNDANTSKKRDKRTQVISFLTADEADRVGLDKKILSYKNPYDTINTTFGCSILGTKVDTLDRTDAVHKRHQLSQIDVLMQDGRKYVYGIPVMNTRQVDVTFNKTGNATTQMSTYSANETIPESNNNGKDGYVEKQEIPAYAHSFLLTGLLSPNYVDVKGDGITEDDMGDAIKFNYSKMPKPFKWRTPVGANSATFSEGLKTDRDDDKSHYIYGEREMWYMYSVESKNMVARFYVKNDRKDSKAVLDENGTIDINWGAQRLYKISLFSKADLVKNGIAAKPVKTVHFNYDYTLCKGAPSSLNGEGKLTLRSIYFTYNGNEKTKKNYYKFNYPTDQVKNPDYNFTAVDRWGNYKPASGNQGGLLNPDYPYATQVKQNADNYAQAWILNNITMPSGGSINVEYEADDYGFVQDRRAAGMFEIAGFGTTKTPATAAITNNTLYQNKNSDNDFIYINVSKAITATTTPAIKKQIEDLYLGNIAKTKQLFMKLSVPMPSDARGSGAEMIPIYAEMIDYGLIPGTNGQKIYIQVKKLESGYTPMVQYSLQFMKNFLPSKAYPGYDVSESGGLTAVVKALGGMYRSFKEIFKSNMGFFKQEGKCRYVETNKSFVRLTNPDLKKLGGGLRVKKIVITDNWNKMTQSSPTANNGMAKATYGQEYFYTKKELVGNQVQTISSGVASWEPTIGGEENPHREMMSYFNRNKKGPFDYSAVELPLAEMFFPSPSVGYSRVEVRSIHRDTVKNAAGIQVTEFFTNREFPTTSNYTSLEDNNATDNYKPSPIMRILKIDAKTAVALSQGFKVDLNDMNGKMKKQSTYSPNNLVDPISYTENFYNTVLVGDNKYKFNHYFPVMPKPDNVITPAAVIGRDIEVMTDFREHKLKTLTVNVNFNLDVIAGVFFPIPIPTVWFPVQKESNIFRSASMLKVVNHYAVLDSVVAVDKGSMVSTKNLVYDAETGDALVTRTNNEHNRPLYNFSYPAHWGYTGMGSAYKNIDVTYSGLSFRNGTLETSGVDMNLFESGDELYVLATNDRGPVGILPCDPNTNPLPKNNAKKIWVVNTAKTGSTTPQIFFIDADGNPYTAKDVYIRIIRSGKRNMLGSGVGSITTLNNPIQNIAGIKKLVFDDAANVIQTSAATYKDHWRVDDMLYKKDSTIKVVTTVNKAYLSGFSNEILNVTQNQNNYSLNFNNTDATLRSYKQNSTNLLTQKIWMRFDILNTLLNQNVDPVGIGLSYIVWRSHYDYSLNPNYGCTQIQPTSLLQHPGLHLLNYPNKTTSMRPLEGNTTVYQRMKTPWYNNNDVNAWTNAFNQTNTLTPDNVSFGYFGGNPTNFQWEGDYGYVPNLLKQMILDKRAGRNYAPGFVSQIYKPSPNIGDDNYRCFLGVIPNYNYCSKAYINITYYPCSKIDSIKNNVGYCSSTTANYSFCFSKFKTLKSINPYVEGVWGNWRTDTTYAYYSDRKEQDPNAPIDTRTAGAIANFKTFWNFNPTQLQRNTGASDVWVWNSTITQYNRKGYDIENKDPLGRYNAGLYGYNQQVPVAVVNNSRYRESMFDGFEDYDYKSTNCAESCSPRRGASFGDIASLIDNTQKHTGKNSLRINAGATINLTAPVISDYQAETPYSMRLRVDSTTYTATVVSPRGAGFKAKYYNFSSSGSSCGNAANAANNILNGSPNAIRQGEQINYPNGFSLPAGINYVRFAARWEGFIQPTKTGNYSFLIAADDGYKLSIVVNGVTQVLANRWDCNWGANTTTTPVNLTAGQLYKVTMDYFQNRGNQFAQLVWKTPDNPNSWEQIPRLQVYSPDNLGDANGTVTTSTAWCTKLDSIQVRGKALTDTFSLIQGKKMLISAWVKEGGNDCKCSTYVKSSINISFTGGNTTVQFKASGSIIEGWQRYEGEFTIPANATGITVGLVNSGTTPTYFDDIRIHPFNANMKSFVYQAHNMRLMAELDENNYASFYEYDDDGTLTRVKKETVKGVKTISETRSALQKAVE